MIIKRLLSILPFHINRTFLFIIYLVWYVLTIKCQQKPHRITNVSEGDTKVDSYWSNYTIMTMRLRMARTAKQSLNYSLWRLKAYVGMGEKMMLKVPHYGTVLDYGCGVGNDMVLLLNNCNSNHVIGMDVSAKALDITAHRLALHNFPENRLQLIKIADDDNVIPLLDNSVDYINCNGVLQHTSNPDKIIREFSRILKPSGEARVMVYNYDSVWLHLSVAYIQKILLGMHKGLSIREAFSHSTDGAGCPLARCYKPEEFIKLAEDNGMKAKFIGSFYSEDERKLLLKYRVKAINDFRLEKEHRDFLIYSLNKIYGMCGVYKLIK